MTITDLRRELDVQAADLPDLAAVRAEAAHRAADRLRRRRARALIAAAAAVVVVAGGASLAASVLHGHVSQSPAARPGATVAPSPGPSEPVTVPSLLPTARTTLPSPSTTVAVRPLPTSLPFGFPADIDWSYASWSVGPDRAEGEVSIGDRDGRVLGGTIAWAQSGPSGVPATSRAVTVGGHVARTWQQQSAPGWQTHVAWTLPDGSGIDIAGGSGYSSVQGQDRAGTLAFAALVSDTATALPAVAAPTRGVGEYSEPQFSFVAGTGTHAGESTSPSVFAAALCRPGSALGPGARPCVGFGAAPAVPASLGSGAHVATVDGQSVYVSADGRTVSRIDGPHTITTVRGDATALSTADLAAILASVPR